MYSPWRAFSKSLVFVAKYAISVWTEGQNGEKKLCLCVFKRKCIIMDKTLILKTKSGFEISPQG